MENEVIEQQEATQTPEQQQAVEQDQTKKEVPEWATREARVEVWERRGCPRVARSGGGLGPTMVSPSGSPLSAQRGRDVGRFGRLRARFERGERGVPPSAPFATALGEGGAVYSSSVRTRHALRSLDFPSSMRRPFTRTPRCLLRKWPSMWLFTAPRSVTGSS